MINLSIKSCSSVSATSMSGRSTLPSSSLCGNSSKLSTVMMFSVTWTNIVTNPILRVRAITATLQSRLRTAWADLEKLVVHGVITV